VYVMQREMQSLKTILGPWYRAEIQRTHRPDDPYVHNQVDSTFQAFAGPSTYRTAARRPQAPFIVDPFDTIFPPSHTIDAEHDSLAPYFPPSPDAVYEAHGRSQIHTHHSSGGMIDMHAQPGERPVPLTPVAPLNLSTSLEGSLIGLRESVAAVSASLDSLARRNDIALTNENMRINEELGSLKYAVHGIRLQVRL
jgi:hypothetical protein